MQIKCGANLRHGEYGLASGRSGPFWVQKPLFLIAQLRVPILAPTLRGHIEDGPDRHQVRRAARILPWIARGTAHFAAPEMPDCAVLSREDIECRIVAAVPGQRVIVAA